MKDNWNAQLYDGSHAFVSQFGNDLISFLAPEKGERILDIGCGTGDLASEIQQRGAEVTGIDQSENMITQAKEKFPLIDFHVTDLLELPYQSEFEAVFSNATLHWVKQPELALERIYQSLKPGGRFVAEFGGKGNVKIISDEVIRQLQLSGVENVTERFPWYFPSIAEYTTLMEKAGFRVTFAQHYDRPTPLEGEHGLRNWIEMFGASFFQEISEEKKQDLIAKVENNLEDTLKNNGTWIADYKRIRVIGIKSI
ncbi:class I SAM-dependent methyltransferase [Saliterribacillus persicus]|uniref:Ubiquinone/menaquinone biosynthesis C-methylase UbiE n=1 Tax=Saliterribacillus persicus TaxID=930114 RepID=A0A368YGH0_9BACI|nr:class I SAM-dependent methyltransferase [Saliterribacillus persicus]RCW77284.1 ubiquinone/menaquinone biosynthesis C-methylase UbiE [Saliterribacillus persicus]